MGGTQCREVLADDTEKARNAVTRLRFIFGPVFLWYIRRGIRLIAPAECEYELDRYNRWRNAPENKKRLSVVGKDMEMQRQISNEINEKKRELIPSGTNGILGADDPVYKKRSHLWFFATVHIVMLVFVVGWSRWKQLQDGNSLMYCVFGIKLIRLFYEQWLRDVLREYWMMSPFLTVWYVYSVSDCYGGNNSCFNAYSRDVIRRLTSLLFPTFRIYLHAHSYHCRWL